MAARPQAPGPPDGDPDVDVDFLADEFVSGARPLADRGATGKGPAPAPSPNGASPRRASARPRSAALPEGVADGTLEAASYLLSTPGVAVLVDGYNVTKRVWPDASIGEQRRRLVALLNELSARTGVHPTVVFDGGDVDDMGRREGTRGVQVRFSPDGVSADTVLIDAVSRSTGGAVVVVSSDNEVRRGATAAGARVVHAADFFRAARV